MDVNQDFKYTIYKTTNKINNKVYIGMHKTKNPYDDYIGSGKLFKRAVKKYGEENFVKEVLFIFDTAEEMFVKEKEIVNQLFIESNNTYNIMEGGCGGYSYINESGKNLYGQNGDINHGGKNLLSGNKMKEFLIEKGLYEEWKQNVSTSLKEKWKRDGFHWTGRKHKDESKKKMSADRKGKYTGIDNSNYGNCWVYSDLESKNKIIKKEELNDYINNGWKPGIKMKYHKKIS
jgi:hypothetical protein